MNIMIQSASEARHREQPCKGPEAEGYRIHPRNEQSPGRMEWCAMRSEVLGSQTTQGLADC